MRKRQILLILISILFVPSLCISQKNKLDSLLKLIPAVKQDTSGVLLYVNVSREYVYSDPEKAGDFAQKALSLSQKINFTKGQGLAERNLGIIEFYTGNFKHSIEIYEKALDLCKRAGDSSTTAQLLRATGISYDRLGNMQRAKEYYLKALSQFETLHDTGGLAACYSSIGIVYNHYSEYEKALEYYFKSLHLREGRKNEERNVADVLNNIGGVYLKLGNFDKALSCYFKAIPIREKMHDARGLGISYNSMCNVYILTSRFDSAEYFANKALECSKKIKFGEVMISSYSFLGEIASKKKNYPLSYGYYMQSLQASIQSGDFESYMIALVNLADLSIITGDYADAEKKYKTVADSAAHYKMTEALEKSFSGLADVYGHTGKFTDAYKYMRKAFELKDTIDAQSSTKAMAEMQAVYQNEKQEKEIALLTKDKDLKNLELEKQQSDLQRQSVFIYSAVTVIFFVLAIAFLLYNRFRTKQRLSEVLVLQNKVIEEKNKDITDSINYAKRIQEAMLPADLLMHQMFPDSFKFFLPRDIVSGDFYWYSEKNGKKIIAAVDCTGHGVPGAFMSMIGNAFLNEIVNSEGITQPDLILSKLRFLVIETLKQSTGESENKDGMDIAVLTFDEKNSTVEFAGANNPLWRCRKENEIWQMEEFIPDKRSIGYFRGKGLPFTLKKTEVRKGDSFYIFSDGYPDQFGGPNQKKFKYKQLKELILSMQEKGMKEQEEILRRTFLNWKNNLEQIDDVLVIGLRI